MSKTVQSLQRRLKNSQFARDGSVREFESSDAGPLLSSREKGLFASKRKRPVIRAGITFHGVPSRLW